MHSGIDISCYVSWLTEQLEKLSKSVIERVKIQRKLSLDPSS